jgi:hypothetical protein
MKDLSLQELRGLYPEIKATSKKRFIELVNESNKSDETEVTKAPERVLADNELTWYNIVEYILSVAESTKKILIKTDSTFDADFLFQHLKEKLFPELEKQDTMLMASSTRRDMHINGTCYVRLVCQANHDHVGRLIAYNTHKTVVN